MKNNYFPQNYILYHNYKIVINSYASHESTNSYNTLKLKSWQNRRYELIEDVPPKNHLTTQFLIHHFFLIAWFSILLLGNPPTCSHYEFLPEKVIWPQMHETFGRFPPRL